jgi:hypothetical protein
VVIVASDTQVLSGWCYRFVTNGLYFALKHEDGRQVSLALPIRQRCGDMDLVIAIAFQCADCYQSAKPRLIPVRLYYQVYIIAAVEVISGS